MLLVLLLVGSILLLVLLLRGRILLLQLGLRMQLLRDTVGLGVCMLVLMGLFLFVVLVALVSGVGDHSE